MRGSGTGGERAPLEWVISALFLLHTRRHRECYGSSQLTHYRDMCREVGGEEGFGSLSRLFAHTLWELACTAVEQRTSQFVRAISVRSRLVFLGGLTITVVGMGSLADGIIRYTSMRLFFSHPDLPTHLPLGVFGEPAVGTLLATAGYAGLYAFLNRRSALALVGMYMAVASALLTLVLGIYDWAFDPVYYSDVGFGIAEYKGVDRFAVSMVETEVWVLALGMVLLAFAARRCSARLGRWWPLLLVVSFVQSPLFERSVFSIFGLLMRIQIYLMHSQAVFDRSEVTLLLFQFQTFLVFAPSIIPGLAWALFGSLLMFEVLVSRRGRPMVAR